MLMKKSYYLYSAALAVLLSLFSWIPVTAQITYALQESFESGIPETWSQEYVIGQQSWIAETGGVNPDGAYEGNSRVAFRNTTGSTQGFVTRLVTPVMDLTGIYQPILVFAQAREHSLGDVDELRIYYRSAPEQAWVLYDENIFTERQKDWTTDTIPLVGVTSSYQLAFEATDKFGSGVVLDYICVRPMPQCTQPEITILSNLTSSSFDLGWNASFDADSCQIKIFEGSSVPTDEIDTTPAAIDTIVVGNFDCSIKGISVNTTYYIYVKAFCLSEASEWSDYYSVYTQATITLPYEENFNREYSSGWLTRPDTWTYGNSWPTSEYTFCPHINSNDNATTRVKYSRDGSSCLVFTGSNNSTSVIEAGQQCYAVTPELEIDDIKDIQVSFWGSSGSEPKGRLIVGVATDPTDPATFVSVDTVEVKSGSFDEFIVTFDNYTGNGKYIVFASAFTEENIFYLDDVVIKDKPACPKVSGINSTELFSNHVTLTWPDLGVESYEVILSNKYILSPSDDMQSNGDTVIIRTTSNTNSCYIDNLTAETYYYTFVRAVCGEDGNGEWSNRYSFQTPCEGTIPMHFSFEEEEGFYQIGTSSTYKMANCLRAYTLHSVPPYCTTGSSSSPAYDGEYKLQIFGYSDSEVRIAFPPVENVQDLWISFMGRSYISEVTYLEVGVMDDFNDITTFTPMDTLTLLPDYDYYEVSFANYSGTGNNIVLLLSNLNTEGFSYALIDAVDITTGAGCATPREVQVDATSTTASFTWTTSGEKTELLVTEETEEGIVTVADTIISNSTNTCLIENLKPNIQTYSYKLRSICGTDTSNWTMEKTFTTECQPVWPFPFSENFESCEAKSSIHSLPTCWETEYTSYTYYSSTTYYPYITSYAYNDSKGLYFSSAKSSPVHADYVILPDIDFESIQGVQLSFMLKQATDGTDLEIGVISDVSDTSRFELVAKCTCTTNNKNEWREIVIPFDSYTGTSRRIMLRTVAGQSGYQYIDEIYVSPLSSCQKPTELSATNASTNSVTLTWEKGKNEGKWDLLVVKGTDYIPASDVTTEDIAVHKVVESVPYTLEEGLEPNQDYYYYLRSICDDGDTTNWTLNYGEFRTTCTALPMPYTETFEDDETNFECFQLGVLEGTTNPPSRSTHQNSKGMYIFNTTASDGTYAILPNLDIESITDYQITFDISTSSTVATNEKKIIVGVITNPSDILSFMPIDTIDAEYNNYIRHTVRFDSYDGDYKGEQGKYIMFLSSFGLEGVTNYVYIDNIVVDSIGACPEVIKVNFDSIGTYDVHFSWQKEAESYRIKLTTEKLTEEELNTENNPYVALETTTDKDSITINDLSRLTTYYVYIQSQCSESQVSKWSNPFTFTTLCPYEYEIPYKETFDEYGTGTTAKPDCWTTYYGIEGTQEEGSSMYCHTTQNYTIDGVSSLYVYTASSSSYDGAMAISPRIAVTDISKMMLSFYTKQSSSTNYPRMVVGLAKNIPDSMKFDAFLVIDTVCLQLDQEDMETSVWYKYQYDLSYLDTLSDKSDYKYIVFSMEKALNRSSATSTTAASGTMFVDDVELDFIPSCFKPENVKAVDRTEQSIKVVWEGESDSYNVQYGPVGFNPDLNEGITVSADTTEKDVTGLSSSTTYEFYVQSNCGEIDGLSAWNGPATMTTLSTVITTYPYNQDFENVEENSKWQFVQLDELENKWYIGNAIAANEGGNSLYISNDEGVSAKYNTSSGGSAWAMRPFKLGTGVYEVSYDWQCYGQTTNDFIRIGFVPAACSFSSSSANTAGKVEGETSTTMSYSATPEGWIDLGQSSSKKYLSGIDTLIHKDTTVIITPELAKTYWLAIYWRNNTSGGDKPDPSAMIDNITITKQSCPYPANIVLKDVMDTTALIGWTNLNNECSEWEVKITDKEFTDLAELDTAVIGVVVTGQVDDIPEYQAIGLTESTTYYVYVRSLCGNDISSWYGGFSFTTSCSPMSIGASWDFEEEGGNYVGTSTKYMSPLCWVVGNKKSTSYTYIPYQIINTASYTYSMSNGSNEAINNTPFKDPVEQHSLYFNTTSSSDGAYAIMPYVEGNLDSMQVRFYARAGYAKGARTEAQNGYQISTVYNSSTYAHSIIVGMVSSYDDISTFVPIDTLEVTPNLTTSMYATADNNYLFDEFIIPLNKTAGRYVAFLSEFGKNNKVYIENVTIEEASGCYAPIIEVKPNGATTAALTWGIYGENTSKWVIAVGLDEQMNSILFTDTVDMQNSYPIEGLEPATTYYVAVQQLCDEEASDDYWSEIKSFTTYSTIPFNEYFSAAINTPEGFSRYNQKFDDQEVNISGWSNTNNATSGWVRDDDGNGIENVHQRARVTSTANYWLITPTIDLSSLSKQTDNVWLTFDMALTESQSGEAPLSTGIDWTDDQFMVVVSTDGGTTWNKNNATVWNNDVTADYMFKDIPNVATNYRVPLDNYCGEKIAIAFFVSSTTNAVTFDLHIDNVHINRYVQINYEEDICPLNDYDNYGFSVDYTLLQEGSQYEAERYVKSNSLTTPDSLVTLKLNVPELVENIIEREICEGDTYEGEGFVASMEGEYKQKLTASTGCDSISILRLSVIPYVRTEYFDTICQGAPYYFNGNEYNRTGIYTDTLSSAVTGCDSIVTLYLKVNEALRTTINERICFGSSYNFNGQILTETGTYIDTLQTASGCDSVVTLELTALPEYKTIITAVVCPGDTYSGNGFVGVPAINGDYERTEQTSDGCDSTIILRLTVLDADTTFVYDTITVNELPYTFYGKEYDATTSAGVYVDTITTSVGEGECEGVIIATLTINPETGILSAEYGQLQIVPTLIEKGGSVRITGTTTADQSFKVEVYNMLGQIVYSKEDYQVEETIQAFTVSGMYLIKGYNDKGELMFGQVLVK